MPSFLQATSKGQRVWNVSIIHWSFTINQPTHACISIRIFSPSNVSLCPSAGEMQAGRNPIGPSCHVLQVRTAWLPDILWYECSVCHMNRSMLIYMQYHYSSAVEFAFSVCSSHEDWLKKQILTVADWLVNFKTDKSKKVINIKVLGCKVQKM